MRYRLFGASALATMIVVATAPAQAATPDTLPGPQGGTCSNVASYSHPSSTVLRLTWTAKCNVNVQEIYHGMTLQRSGKAVSSSLYCYSSNATLRTCTQHIDIADPSGSQAYVGHDELEVDATLLDGMNPTPYGTYELKGNS